MVVLAAHRAYLRDTMILRARHLFLAWLAYGALQFALLGVGGVAGAQVAIGDRDARPQSQSHSVAPGKRVLAPEFNVRHAPPVTPFGPSARISLDLPTLVACEALADQPRRAETSHASVLPPARAPPALA